MNWAYPPPKPKGKLMIQIKVGAGLLATVLSAWSIGVYSQRKSAADSVPPLGSARRRFSLFSPGSADEVLADQLRTGDVLLFSRKCVMYQPLGALACQIGKAKSRCEFDHAGVVVVKRGRPFVAEETFSGIKVRPYDERIYLTTAESVVVRRLAEPLTPSQRAVFEASVDSLENLPSSAVHQLARCLRGPPVADPVLTTAFQAIGSAVDPLEVKDFAGSRQPLALPLQRETIVRMK